MYFVVNVDSLGSAEDFGNEVLLVSLAGDGDVRLCEDIFEVDDLERFAGRGDEEGGWEGR